MIKGFIFDVDGVIINTENIHFLAYKDVFKNYDYDLTAEDYKKYFSGKSIKGGVLALISEVQLPDSENQTKFIQTISEQKISQTLKYFQQQVTYYPDTIKFIQALDQGITLDNIGQVQKQPILAMATGLEAAFFQYVLAKHNLKKLFSVLVTADDYEHSKPHPECYLQALKKMELTAEEVIGIEDSPSGIAALNKANIFSIGLTNTHTEEELNKAKIVTSSLLNLVKK